MPAVTTRPEAARQASRDALLLLVGLGCVLAWDASGLDLPLTRLFAPGGRFIWKDAWLTRELIHGAGRALAWVVFAALALDAARAAAAPGTCRVPTRAERVYWVLVILACLVLVPMLKRWSQTSCPWDLAEFGGQAAYVPHWLAGVSDGGPGRCFPSGHTSVAFAFVGVYFLWRPYQPARARSALLAVLLTGALFGLGQMARGAHHLSHVLWSAWLCAAISVLAARLPCRFASWRALPPVTP